MGNSRVGWRATAGSVDKGELIALFQSALVDEIDDLKKGKAGKQFEIREGKRLHSIQGVNIYRFLTETWLKDDTPVSVIVEGQPIRGYVVSSDPEGINNGLEADKGEFIKQATIQSSSL